MASDNRKFYITLDNTIGIGRTSGNVKIMNNILKVFRDAGLNVSDGGIGPSKWTNVIRSKKRASNTVIVGFVNGIDAGVVEEATNNYGLNRNSAKEYNNRAGVQLRGGKDNEFHGTDGFMHNVTRSGKGTERNNQLILCFFYNCKDFYNPGSEYYDWLVRAHDDNYSISSFKGTAHPRKWLEDYDIWMVYNRGDYDGISTAKKAVELINAKANGTEPGETPSTDTEDETTTPSVDNADKTLSKKIIKNVYQVPWYEKIITTHTDENGAFLIQQPKDMTIKGEYLVNLYFAGDATHEACNRSIRIQKFNGEVVSDKLLESTITEYYSDGSNQETLHTGSSPKDNTIKTKTITITYTYEGGVLKNTDIKTVENYKVIEPAQETENVVDVIATNDEVNNTTPTNTKGADPFSNDMALLSDGKPDVSNMSTGGKGYVMYDDTRSYNLTKEQFHEVYYRDSKSLQLNSYKVSKYTAFQSTDSQTYNVIPRENWNAVVQAVHHWLVRHNGTDWFNSFTIDFANNRVQINGQNIAFTGKTSQYHVVVDYQDNTSDKYGTCGPTSCSMTTQWLYKYVSEAKLKKDTGHGYGGIGPTQCVTGLKKNGFAARNISGLSAWRSTLEEGKGLVFHLYWHYVCLYDIVGNYTYCANPVPKYRLRRGWQTISAANSAGIGGHTKVELNWNISEDEKQKINHFYRSMGGAWSRNANTNITLPVVTTGR